IVRSASNPETLVPEIRQTLRNTDPNLPLSSVATMDDLVARALDKPRSLSLLIGSFAIVALTLSVVGVYGVMAYYVEQHTKEIGIRLALGGSRRDVARLVVGQGMTLVAGGVAIGVLAAAAFTRLTSSLLFGVQATDPAIFGGVSAALLFVAFAACAIPAARATVLEPAAVLRNE